MLPFDADGWLHTGDSGVVDKDNFIYIKGRVKTMLLGPSGQNIYPEEIEAKLINMKLVSDCLVVSRNNQVVALVHPDYKMAEDNRMGNSGHRQTDGPRTASCSTSSCPPLSKWQKSLFNARNLKRRQRRVSSGSSTKVRTDVPLAEMLK